MFKGVTWPEFQEKSLLIIPYGLLAFLFLFFALPTSKAVNVVFYLAVLLPTLLSMKLLIREPLIRSALLPILVLIFFWALFSFVSVPEEGWGNVAKRFRHALYVLSFVSASYYLLSVRFLSTKALLIYLFCLALLYSIFSFVYFYGLEGHALVSRLYPVQRLDSPIFMAIILTVYGVPLVQQFSMDRKPWLALLLLGFMAFFLYFYNSRSAIVGLFGGVVGISLLSQSAKQKYFSLFTVMLLVMALVGSYFFGNLLDRGVSYRLDIWLSSFEKVLDCGLLLGCGFGGNSEVVLESGQVFQHSHNLFLSHFVNTGLLGLFSLLGLLGYVVYQGLSLRSVMVLGLIVGLLALFFDGSALLTNPNALWLIFWLPLIIVYWEINQKKHKMSLPNRAGSVVKFKN